jgi:hypothetical protein
VPPLLRSGGETEALTTSEDVEDSRPEPDLIGETSARLDGVTHAVLIVTRRTTCGRHSATASAVPSGGGYSEASGKGG